jgi:hypothetical protein
MQWNIYQKLIHNDSLKYKISKKDYAFNFDKINTIFFPINLILNEA